MKLVILSLILSISSLGFTTTTADFLQVGSNAYKDKKGHFLFDISADSIEFKNNFDFSGSRKKYDKTDPNSMFGSTFHFGYDFYLGKGLGFGIGSHIGFALSNDKADNKASDETPDIIETVRENDRLYTGDIGARLFYRFEVSSVKLNFQPFIGMYIGKMKTNSDRDYSYLGDGTANSAQTYKAKIEQEAAYLKLAAGINVISRQGIFGFAKVSSFSYEIETREKSSTSLVGGSTTVVPLTETKPNESETVLAYNLGFGLMF